jgi:aspartyl-tRNA(Asn)/glutamyl-tRNA(Gln) amidotransferase subunit A
MPLSWSLDHVGPLARSAEDTAIVLQAVAGYDSGDAASSETSPGKYAEALRTRVGRLRLARPGGVYFENLDSEVASAVAAAIQVLAEITGPIREVELPPVPALSILFVEASAYLSSMRKHGSSDFSPAVRNLIDMGTRIPAVNYAEALRELTLVRRAAARVFEEVDLVVTPTTPDTPVTIEAARAPATNRGPPVSARNTTPFNIYGLPTVSVCCGFTRAGLPIGLQLTGAPFADGSVLALAHAYQQRTDWHRRVPPISAHGI